MEQTIRRFEPRLVRVSVTLLDPKDELEASFICGSKGCCAPSRRPSRSPSIRSWTPPPPRSWSSPSAGNSAALRGRCLTLCCPITTASSTRSAGLQRILPRAHPKIAGRLRLAPDAVDDPHVARLLEGAAFLAARVHHRLDDEFPELTDALLGVLYPHYLAPVPSAAIVQFQPQPDLALSRLAWPPALRWTPSRSRASPAGSALPGR